jgi:hypothetical protein
MMRLCNCYQYHPDLCHIQLSLGVYLFIFQHSIDPNSSFNPENQMNNLFFKTKIFLLKYCYCIVLYCISTQSKRHTHDSRPASLQHILNTYEIPSNISQTVFNKYFIICPFIFCVLKIRLKSQLDREEVQILLPSKKSGEEGIVLTLS